jgi:hypothetical protein
MMNEAVGTPVLDGPARRAMMLRAPVAVLLAVAFMAALVGLGGLLSDPARAWPWVTVLVAGALGAVGVFFVRRLAVHIRLRVAKPFSPGRLGGMLAAIAAILAVVGVLAMALEMKMAGVLLAVLPVPVVWYLRSSSALIVGWDGVRLNGTLFPFGSVSRLVLTAGQGDQVTVSLDLRAGAALPNGMTEDRPHIAIDRKRLDIQLLTATTHRFSRGNTRVAVL